MSAHTPLAILLELSEANRLTSDDFTRALSAAKVRTTKPGTAPTKVADGGGLTLYIPPTGAKVWRYRYRLGGKEQILTVGAYPDVSLEHARIAHRAARWLVARGIHPLSYAEQEAKRRAAEAQAFDEHTFRAIAEKWQQVTAANLAPRTVEHRRAMLDKHVMPTIGARSIGAITRKELHSMLTELDQVSPVTARHCRSYIRQIFEYAEDAELVDANPTPTGEDLIGLCCQFQAKIVAYLGWAAEYGTLAEDATLQQCDGVMDDLVVALPGGMDDRLDAGVFDGMNSAHGILYG